MKQYKKHIPNIINMIHIKSTKIRKQESHLNKNEFRINF